MSDGVVARRDRRRRRRGTALLALTIAALTVAVACVGVALVARADTADVQARADPVRRRVRELTAAEQDAERRLLILRQRSETAGTTLAGLLAACQAQVDASNHAVDVANQAVDRYNSAQADVAAAFQGAGDAAVTDVEQKTAAVHTAFRAAQTAVTKLMASGG